VSWRPSPRTIFHSRSRAENPACDCGQFRATHKVNLDKAGAIARIIDLWPRQPDLPETSAHLVERF
jgi:hypothetical protein